MDWNKYKETQEKNADRSVPCGEYDVEITDVTRMQSRQNPANYYVLVSFGEVPDGDVPGVFLQDDMHTGDPKTDSWLRSKACSTLESLAQSAGRSMAELTADIDDDDNDAILLAAEKLIGCTLRVEVVENGRLKGGKETIPVIPYGI